MKALQIETFGNPPDVVRAVDLPDVGAPAAGEVVTISAPVAATYGFDQVGEAIRKAAESTGKVLFTPGT